MIILFILNLFVYTQIFKLKVENYVFQLPNDVCWRIAFLMLVSFRIFPNFASRLLVQNCPLLLPVHSRNGKLYPLGDVCGVVADAFKVFGYHQNVYGVFSGIGVLLDYADEVVFY